MAVDLDDAVANARSVMGSVDRGAADWGDRWVFYTACRRQFGAGTVVIDKESGEQVGTLQIADDPSDYPADRFGFDLPEGLYDEPFD